MITNSIEQMKNKKFIYLLCIAALLSLSPVYALPSDSWIPKIWKINPAPSDTLYPLAKTKALLLTRQTDTTLASSYWPNVEPGSFYRNVAANVENPNGIYQGSMTNFCGYAAFANFMLLRMPHKYVQLLNDLYLNGEATCNGTLLKPSEAVRVAAGTLYGKGILDIHTADQLLFLTLADEFKGYMNVFNLKYQPGDEDNIWAATTLAKFDRMMKRLLGVRLNARGSDLLRPMFMSRYRYTKKKLAQHDVILYVNSHFLNPSVKHFITLRVPTHYIHLYSIEKRKKGYIITYWDYGLKTRQAISQRMFDKLIFAIISIKKNGQL